MPSGVRIGDGVGDMLAVERAAGRAIETVMSGRVDGRFAVDRPAETIQYPVEQIGAYGHPGIDLTGNHAVVQLDAIDFFERQGEHVAVAETDDLNAHPAPAGSNHLAEIPHRGGRAA